MLDELDTLSRYFSKGFIVCTSTNSEAIALLVRIVSIQLERVSSRVKHRRVCVASIAPFVVVFRPSAADQLLL